MTQYTSHLETNVDEQLHKDPHWEDLAAEALSRLWCKHKIAK